jgi:Arc/MetJ family transcription regulator
MSRTTVFINDELLEEAKKITGESKTSRVLNVALEALVKRARLNSLLAKRGSGLIELSNEEIEELGRNE